MLLIPGGPVTLSPDAAPVELAPFFIDGKPASVDGKPTVGVTWDQAAARCAERGLRLPTDAEWQRLATTPASIEGLTGSVFHWTTTAYAPPAGEPEAQAPEMRGDRRVVRGACCGFMPAWSAPEHRAAYPRDRPSSWIGYRCAGSATADADPNLSMDGRHSPDAATIDEGEAVRQLLAGLWGPDRQPTDPTVLELVRAQPPTATVADVGCGLGALALELQGELGPDARVLAVDVDTEVLAFAQAVAEQRGASGVRTVLAQPDDPSLDPECCDLVLLYDMANSLRGEHLPGFAAGLSGAVRPGGQLAVYHLPGPPPPSPVLEALAAQGLELERTVVDPSSSPMDPSQRADKLWIFVKP
jgi:SAM-dependent methyltransferase